MSPARMPIVFVAHGAPPLLDDAPWMAELAAWGAALPRPESIVVVSAHWEEPRVTLGAIGPVPLIHDFYGFPARYYETTYPAPGAPTLAARVRSCLDAAAIPHGDAPRRGLDHGGYLPLVAMFPDASIPVLPLSMPPLEPGALVALGRALAPLRREGVLLLTSGFLTHNMAYAFRRGTPPWARDFDAWAAAALVAKDIESLTRFYERGPSAATALPTAEHFAPVLIAAGAADEDDAVTFPITGWWMDGAFTKRSVQLG